MATRSSFCIAALLCLITSILAAPPLQLPPSSHNISSVNLGAAPLPPYPPPDPLAYQVHNYPVILVFGNYLTQRRDETWIQTVVASAVSECSRHQSAEPLRDQVYAWNHKRVDLKVKPVVEAGGPRMTWGMWGGALHGIHEFLQKYDGVEGSDVGVRMNFQILVKANNRGLDAQFTVGKGLLDMI